MEKETLKNKTEEENIIVLSRGKQIRKTLAESFKKEKTRSVVTKEKKTKKKAKSKKTKNIKKTDKIGTQKDKNVQSKRKKNPKEIVETIIKEKEEKQETFDGCETIIEIPPEERIKLFEGDLRINYEKKIILEGILREVKANEKRLNEKILECMREMQMPLLVEIEKLINFKKD